MPGMLRRLPLILLLAGMLTGAAVSAEASAIIYLIRHAEAEMDGTRDPDLNAVGRTRARWLSNWFADKGVTAIYSTELKRTLETVAPLSERLNMPIVPYDPRALEDVAEILRGEEGVIVVSGHSNTTPVLVNLLIGEERFPWLDERWMFDRIFQVRLGEDGTGVVKVLYSQPRSTEPAKAGQE